MADVITAWSDFILTDKGLALRQAAIANGLRVSFVYAEIGEGVPTDLSSIPLMTSLILFAKRVEVKRSLSEASTHYVDIRIDNLNYTESVIMRETGLYAKLEPDPDNGEDPVLAGFYEPLLYGYSYTTQGYDAIPAGKDFHRILTIGANVEISRSKEVIINYDGTAVYVTHEDIDAIVQMTQESYNASQVAQAAAQDALTAVQEGAGGGTIVSETQPNEQANGDLWLDTSDGPSEIGESGVMIANAVVSDTEPQGNPELWLQT